MSEPVKRNTRRPQVGRLLFCLALVMFALSLWRAHDTGMNVWSHARRYGGLQQLIQTSDGLAAVQLYRDRVLWIQNSRVDGLSFERPMRLVPDGEGGVYVLGMLSSKVGRILPDGVRGNDTVFPANYCITALLPEDDGVWAAGYRLGLAEDEAKDIFYFPEYHKHEWFLQWFPGKLPSGEVRLRDAIRFEDEVWHEETAGNWHLLATHDRLLVVNDQAESIHCLTRSGDHVIWRAATKKRPVAAVRWGDRLIVASGQSGVVEAFRLDNGGHLWSMNVATGLVDMIVADNVLIAADRAHDQLIVIDPLEGKVVREVDLAGGPHGLLLDGGNLVIGLDSANRLVWLNRKFKTEKQLDLAAEVRP